MLFFSLLINNFNTFHNKLNTMNNLILQSKLSTRAKNALIDYYNQYNEKDTPEALLKFTDLEPLNMNKVQILRNVGLGTVKEIEEFLTGKIFLIPYKKTTDLKTKTFNL